MWEFATTNPGYTFLIVWVLAWAFRAPFEYSYRAYKRRLRSRDIAAHGWPTPPLDADGDVMYPDNEEE